KLPVFYKNLALKRFIVCHRFQRRAVFAYVFLIIVNLKTFSADQGNTRKHGLLNPVCEDDIQIPVKNGQPVADAVKDGLKTVAALDQFDVQILQLRYLLSDFFEVTDF
ncbi:MAG: hypothetical protein PVI36_04690, partial [Desulfobacterales bacterium]